MKKYFFITLVLTLLLSSCTNYGALKINTLDINKFNMKSASDIQIELKLGVDNPLNSGVFLKGLDGDIKHNGAKFARVELVKSDTIIAKTKGVYKATLRVVVEDPMLLLTMGMNMKSLNFDEYTTDAKITIANTKGGARKVKVKNYPLKELANKLKR